jgi:hypothetical protein
VVGAGRSGTSALTRGIAALGVELGGDLRRGRGKNPTGFFEDRALARITTRLKRLLRIWGVSVRLIEPEEWQRPEVIALQQDAVEVVRRRFGDDALWGFKHGRTLRLLPFWRAVFGAAHLDASYVVALRNPLAVARSRARLDRRRGTQEKSNLEWLVNVVPYFRQMIERPFVVVDYDRLMARPVHELTRVAERLCLPLHETNRRAVDRYAEEFLDSARRHSVYSTEDLAAAGVLDLVREAYCLLHRLIGNEAHADFAEWRHAWRRVEGGVAALAPVLRHIDKMQEALVQAQANPIGPLQSAPRLWRKLSGR